MAQIEKRGKRYYVRDRLGDLCIPVGTERKVAERIRDELNAQRDLRAALDLQKRLQKLYKETR